jgi:aspartyl aminopeptidase
MARSFLLSADVSNGLNPGFVDEEIYAEGLTPAPNKGMVISKDRNGGMATEPWAFVLATRICERAGQEIQCTYLICQPYPSKLDTSLTCVQCSKIDQTWGEVERSDR